MSSSTVSGAWNSESGVSNTTPDTSVGSQDSNVTSAIFEAIAADAVAASAFWAGQSGTDITVNNGTGLLTASGGGANVFNVTGGFELSSTTLQLAGGEGDFFVFNIPEDQLFSVQSSVIELLGNITASEVLFNVLGNIDAPNVNDNVALVGSSTVVGTLLAPGREVTITESDFCGQIIAGGNISISSSGSIKYSAFETDPADPPEPPDPSPSVVPEPGSASVWGLGLLAVLSTTLNRRKKRVAGERE